MAASASAATTLLYDQLIDLGDPMPPGMPSDEASFCALVESAGGAAAVGEGDNSSSGGGGGPLSALARALVGRVRAAEAGRDGAEAMEEDEVGFVSLGGWVDRLIR